MLEQSNEKARILSTPISHIDVSSFDARPIVAAMAEMSFTAREVARAAEILDRSLSDAECSIILTIAGSTSAAGCMHIYRDMVENGMVDVIVATGASIIDMDFFEALGFRHYKGTPDIDDTFLRQQYIDRIYDTYIDENELQACDDAIKSVADELDPQPYSSREFIWELGKWLKDGRSKKRSLIEACFDSGVPIFVPAFSDCSAGFGLAKHQNDNPSRHVTIDSVRDFRELTSIKVAAGTTGLFMIGGGTPKNFVQDTVICAEILGQTVDMHKYAVQISVADVRDGACSSSTLKEAASWGKVETSYEQMVYAEATSVLPLIISDVFHKASWRSRPRRRYADTFSTNGA